MEYLGYIYVRMYTLKKLIIDLKFKFNWTSYIFLCQIWQSYYFRKIWKEEMKQEEASNMWGKKEERAGLGTSRNQKVALQKRVEPLFSLIVHHQRKPHVMNRKRFIEEFTVKKPCG